MDEKPRYWFPAKRYGWGWGPPRVWQGWAVLLAFVGLALGGVLIFPPEQQVVFYLGWVTFLAAGFLAVCWFKGEPPKWRWGGD